MRSMICFVLADIMFILMTVFAFDTPDNRWLICLGVGILSALTGIYYLPPPERRVT